MLGHETTHDILTEWDIAETGEMLIGHMTDVTDHVIDCMTDEIDLMIDVSMIDHMTEETGHVTDINEGKDIPLRGGHPLGADGGGTPQREGETSTDHESHLKGEEKTTLPIGGVALQREGVVKVLRGEDEFLLIATTTDTKIFERSSIENLINALSNMSLQIVHHHQVWPRGGAELPGNLPSRLAHI